MAQRNITHATIFRVLIGGFACVLLLLLAASYVGLRNIRSIQASAAALVRDQALTNRLIDELERQQTSLGEVYSVLARDPDSVDFDRIMAQLDEADRNIARIAVEGARTPEHELWQHLERTSHNFSDEARRLLNDEAPETYASIDLFRFHGAFIDVIRKLIEQTYRKVSSSQRLIDANSRRLLRESGLFFGLTLLLALVFAFVTIRLTLSLLRRMDWQTAELSRVSWHMLEAQETTARRFSHELHDELGQSLTAVRTNLAALDGDGRVADCIALVDDAIGNVRQLSQLLRPTILDDFGLEAGLRWLAEGFANRTGIVVDFKSTCPGRLADDTETHLFRIAQEALTNIARHAEATRVQLRLDATPVHVCLSIRDDGRGLPSPSTTATPRGLGMVGMHARARSLDGGLTVHSQPGQGVLIEVRIPIAHETHPHSAG